MRKAVVLAVILISCIPWITTCGAVDSTSQEEEISISSYEDSPQSSVSYDTASSSSSSYSSEYSSSSTSSNAVDDTSHSSQYGASSSAQNTTYRITYYIKTLDGEIQSVPNVMWIENGNYPDYTVGENTTVSALKNAETARFSFEFLGWYCDSACTIPFNGVLGTGNEGDVALYAQVRKTVK
jgi:cytoskeletal protein RodZ